MAEEKYKNYIISSELAHILDQLDFITNLNINFVETPARGEEGGIKEKDFPRILGHS